MDKAQPAHLGYGVRLGSGPRPVVGGHGFESPSVIEPSKTYSSPLSMIKFSIQTPKRTSQNGPFFESALPHVLECAKRGPKASEHMAISAESLKR